MGDAPIVGIVAAGLPATIVASLRTRLEGCAVIDASDDAQLSERVRGAPDVLILGGWALGDDAEHAVRRWRAGGLLSATRMVCCLSITADAAVLSRLVGELQVSRLLFLPLDEAELARQVALLAGVSVRVQPAGASGDRVAAGLAAIWQRFREPTLARLDVLEAAALALMEGTLSTEQRANAQREAHKLAGAAGSFGFPRSSQLARQLEERLSLDGLVPADAVGLAEQLVLLRTDLEGAPRALDGDSILSGEAPTGPERVLLLVGAEPALAERIESEGAARGLRVVTASDATSARTIARTPPPSVLAVCIATHAHAPSMLELVSELASAQSPVPTIVLASRDAASLRVDAVRRGAQRFVELPASPATVVAHALALAGKASAPPRRILAVDDDPQILALLRTVLEGHGLEVHTVDDPLRVWSALEEVQPDLLVLDVDMPHVTGLELARAVRSDARWSHVPIVFLTARTDADTVRRAYAAGADDHVGKPILVEELVTRVRNRLDRTSSREDGGDLDATTGVGTRRGTADLLARFLHLARRRGDNLSLGSIVVDDVAAIAERHGPAAVDIAWRAVAQLLARALRGEDVVGRWSADELVVGLYGASKADAARRLTGLFDTIARRELTAPAGATFSIACGGGLAQYPDDGQDVESLHAAALGARRARARAGAAQLVMAGSDGAPGSDHSVDIVIVDDDEALAGLLEHALVTSGYGVHIYRDGESASAGLLAEPPEVVPRVILLDVDLPALNGLDLLRRLHRAGVTSRSRVVMLTARVGEQDVLTALSLGAADHVAKPFSVAVLLQKLRTVLGEDE